MDRKRLGFWDTGAFLTLADPRVVRGDAYEPGFSIELASGAIKNIPRALVGLDYGFREKRCHIGVMSGLPADVLLGNNLGELRCHYVGAVTRSQASQGPPTTEGHPDKAPALDPLSATNPDLNPTLTWDRDTFTRELDSYPTLSKFPPAVLIPFAPNRPRHPLSWTTGEKENGKETDPSILLARHLVTCRSLLSDL